MVNTSKTVVALPPKDHAPTAEKILLLRNVDVRVAYEGGVTVVGVPIGNDKYVPDRAREIVKEVSTDHFTRCLANMPDKHAAAQDWLPRKGSRHGAVTRSIRGTDNGAQWAYEKILKLPDAAEAQSFFQERVPMIGRYYNPTNNPKHAILPERKGEGCLRRKRGECLPL